MGSNLYLWQFASKPKPVSDLPKLTNSQASHLVGRYIENLPGLRRPARDEIGRTECSPPDPYYVELDLDLCAESSNRSRRSSVSSCSNDQKQNHPKLSYQKKIV